MICSCKSLHLRFYRHGSLLQLTISCMFCRRTDVVAAEPLTVLEAAEVKSVLLQSDACSCESVFVAASARIAQRNVCSSNSQTVAPAATETLSPCHWYSVPLPLDQTHYFAPPFSHHRWLHWRVSHHCQIWPLSGQCFPRPSVHHSADRDGHCRDNYQRSGRAEGPLLVISLATAGWGCLEVWLLGRLKLHRERTNCHLVFNFKPD